MLWRGAAHVEIGAVHVRGHGDPDQAATSRTQQRADKQAVLRVDDCAVNQAENSLLVTRTRPAMPICAESLPGPNCAAFP